MTRTFSLLFITMASVNAASYSNPKIDQTKTSKTCIFFTGPHSIYLNNAAALGRYKAAEADTDDIARAMAKTIGGGYATWKNNEKKKARQVALDHGKNKGNKQLENMNNQDPNYMLDRNRMKHGWMKYLREARRSCTNRSPGNTRGMHLDMHGMTDATAARIGEHLVIGTRAMETTQNAPRAYNTAKSLSFRNALKKHLNGLLNEIEKSEMLTIKMKGGKKLPLRIARGWEPTTCNSIVATGHRSKCKKDVKNGVVTLSTRKKRREKFVGDWSKKDALGRLRSTLSRVSTEKMLWSKYGTGSDKGTVKPFGCAVQIEMSGQLRKLLANTTGNDYGKRFAEQLKKVYDEARCSHKQGAVQLS